MASRGFVLTFHSHNVSGNGYASNDHVALDRTLDFLERLRIPVLRLLSVARELRRGTFDTLPGRFACITFDDGSDYDWRDLGVPRHGPQPPIYSILGAPSPSPPGPAGLSRAPTTSFTLASPP